MSVKYQDEITQIFSDLFREDWMDDENLEELITEVIKVTGYTLEKMSHDIQIGVDNGHSVEYQSKLIAHIFKTLL